MLRRASVGRLLVLPLLLAACGGSTPNAVGDDPPIVAESLAPLTGSEIRYLAFQVFEGAPDPTIPFDSVLVYTPRAQVAAVVRSIVGTIGVRGGARTRLAFILGPIAFDHTDDEVRRIIDDGFAIAAAEDVAVGFHLDDAMFWSRRADLMSDSANIEWTGFDGAPASGLNLSWAHPPGRMTYNAPAIRAEVTRRAREVIGPAITAHVTALTAQGKADRFAGVIAGWESHMGQDVSTRDRVGFHALANRGFGPGRPPADVGAEIASVVAEFIARWTDGLALGGVSPTRIYTHVAFVPKEYAATLELPSGVTWEQLLDAAPSSQRPSVAFAANARPGFSTYPVRGLFEAIQVERAKRGDPWWASSEGTNLIPGGPAGNSGMSMETYLARQFNHGAALVTIFSWGIGGDALRGDAFRVVTQGPEALAAYRKFLAQ